MLPTVLSEIVKTTLYILFCSKILDCSIPELTAATLVAFPPDILQPSTPFPSVPVSQSESESTSDISKMIDSVPSKGGGVKPNQAQFKRINNNQDLAKLNQRTSTGHKTVIVQRQVVEVPVPV